MAANWTGTRVPGPANVSTKILHGAVTHQKIRKKTTGTWENSLILRRKTAQILEYHYFCS